MGKEGEGLIYDEMIDSKKSRQIYDYIGDREKTHRWTEKKFNLVIDPSKQNPIDQFFTQEMFYYDKFAIPFHPKMIMGWFVIAKRDKKVEGKIVDIYPTRDLLLKTKKGNMPVAFEDIVELKKNKP